MVTFAGALIDSVVAGEDPKKILESRYKTESDRFDSLSEIFAQAAKKVENAAWDLTDAHKYGATEAMHIHSELRGALAKLKKLADSYSSQAQDATAYTTPSKH